MDSLFAGTSKTRAKPQFVTQQAARIRTVEKAIAFAPCGRTLKAASATAAASSATR